MNGKRLIPVCCILSMSISPARSQEPGASAINGVGSSVAVEAATPAPAAGESGNELSVSELLRSNLEETIREGEKLLRDLPQARLKVTRARISNLRTQLGRKAREQKELQDSLGALRADFFRRSAALRTNVGKVDAGVLASRQTKLEDDYEMHAAFFEEELGALDEDVAAIEETIRQLESRSTIEESLRPVPPVDPTPPREAAARLREIPARLDPFTIESFVPSVRGRSAAPPSLLWAVKGEIALRRGDLDSSERFWRAALEALPVHDPACRSLLGNLAAVAYARGDYVASYQIFAHRIRQRDEASLTGAEAYTMAVLSYLNGLVDDARSYLSRADEGGRRRMASVLGSTIEA